MPTLFQGDLHGEKARIGVAVSRFSKTKKDGKPLGEVLLEGCLARLASANVDSAHVAVAFVPGAFELPLAARELAKRCYAVIALGVVIRGETPHFDYVAGECARGVAQVSIETGVPVIFGVLTCDDDEQARARCGGVQGHKGIEAAEAALEMASVVARVRSNEGTVLPWNDVSERLRR